MEIRRGKQLEDYDTTIYGSGTLDDPYKPEISKLVFSNQWLKYVSDDKRVRQSLYDGCVVYISNTFDKFSISLSPDDEEGLKVNTNAVIEPDEDGLPTKISQGHLGLLRTDTKKIRRIFSKSLGYDW